MKRTLPLHLQMFAEPNEDIVIVEPTDDDNVDDEIVEPTPEPHIITPPAPNPMPSTVAGEAWRNVEEMLVTLSNNVRIGMNDIRDDVKKLLTEIREQGTASQETLAKLGLTMDEFKELLRNATVEETPETTDNNTPPAEPKPKRGGHLSRRGR